MEEINNRIKREICYHTIESLTDKSLLPKYKESDSVKNKINDLSEIIDKHLSDKSLTDKEKRNKIIDDLTLTMVPPGLKGVVRGLKFNNIVQKYITNLNLVPEKFDICFEKMCENHPTDEKPDWYIIEKSTNKILIGMNQLDLWSGGAQSNRGSKYIIENKHNTKNTKLLCVICNNITFKNTKRKEYKLFETGFKNNTLCYLKNLSSIISSYFGL